MSDTCSKHPLDIPGWDGSLEELADAVENMRYDKAYAFVHHLSRAFRKRALRDRVSGKKMLAHNLSQAADHLDATSEAVFKSWVVCKPHMKVEE